MPKQNHPMPKAVGWIFIRGDVMAESFGLPGYLTAVMARLEKNGFEVFVVGGAVRDLLLNKTPLDYDLTTNARPEQLVQLFADCKLVLTGLKHGTVTVIAEHHPVEITTYRVDGSYADNRHPDSVSFTPDITKDLARRDFTVNAMCYNPNTGILDPFGGRRDLAAGVLQTVGEPGCRFKEDALRMLRALRFAATLGFTLQAQTENAVLQHAILLRTVSRERILAELKRLLVGNFAGQVLTRYLYVLFCAEPALFRVIGNGSDPVDFSEVSLCPAELPLRVAAFFVCLGRANCGLGSLPQSTAEAFGPGGHGGPGSLPPFCQSVLAAMRALRFDRKTTTQVLTLLQLFCLPLPQATQSCYRLCGCVSPEQIKKACVLKAAFHGQTEKVQAFEAACNRCFAGCCTVAQLNITGAELAGLGITGRAVGTALNRLLQAVQQQKCPNEPGALLQFAREHLKG